MGSLGIGIPKPCISDAKLEKGSDIGDVMVTVGPLVEMFIVEAGFKVAAEIGVKGTNMDMDAVDCVIEGIAATE